MSLIVNGRFIRNPKLIQAILKGYDTLLPIGKYPIALLSIEMDPVLVDVNVHPAKLEVRFSKEQELFDMIQTTIQKAFREETLIPEANTTQKRNNHKSEQATMVFERSHNDSKRRENKGENEQTESTPQKVMEKTEMPAPSKERVAPFKKEEQENTFTPTEEETTSRRVPEMYPIGQLHGTYIIAQNEEGMYMVDQHAAQERIKYERFKKKLAQPEQTVQELLVPLTFTFPTKTSLKIEENIHVLEEVGLFFESFGTNTYIVRSHPKWFPEGYESEIIEEIVEELEQSSTLNLEELRDDAAALMSCKGSIKANHHLTIKDMEVLLEDLAAAQDPFTCPHGRPIIVFFSEYDIEKMFKRVMN